MNGFVHTLSIWMSFLEGSLEVMSNGILIVEFWENRDKTNRIPREKFE